MSVHMILGVESFVPKRRLAHSSILVEDKLYFFGGFDAEDFQVAKELFYLDVSRPFDKSNKPWVYLTSIPFGSLWATVAYNNINNDSNIYLFGGYMIDEFGDLFTSIIHRFNINSSTWSIPTVGGNSPERRRSMKAVSNNGKLYIFGGKIDEQLGSQTTHFFNEMIIFDTVRLSWSIISSVGAPIARALYTATLLPNGFIVYIGGQANKNGKLSEIDMGGDNTGDGVSVGFSNSLGGI
ncbi:2118_t:CDS:2 [Funneliformis geosporum]|uniref:2118_t:CDS:1 n=1 Tax=Funneliformis geosporum TaxID=1117311 RepID=A0A9W4WVX0_9GLOM|nr:2118_t:CDS:2 [Funneliformis geosporum]